MQDERRRKGRQYDESSSKAFHSVLLTLTRFCLFEVSRLAPLDENAVSVDTQLLENPSLMWMWKHFPSFLRGISLSSRQNIISLSVQIRLDGTEVCQCTKAKLPGGLPDRVGRTVA